MKWPWSKRNPVEKPPTWWGDEYAKYKAAHPEAFEPMKYALNTCGTCKWWGLANMSHSHIAEFSDGKLYEMCTNRVTSGVCKRHAPSSKRNSMSYGFPESYYSDTCGDWERKDD